MPLFTEDIQTFYDSEYFQKLTNDDLLFNIGYRTVNKTISEASLTVLGEKITPHALRHSSATHYAKEFDGNMQLLADRYGWTYNSKELATYIRRSGAYQKQAVKKVFQNELQKVQSDYKQLQEVVSQLERRLKRIELTELGKV